MTLLNSADAVYLGGTSVDRVYLGAQQIWPVAANPATVPGLLWWIDPSVLGLADGTAVTDIPDLSGNGHATSSMFGDHPVFVAGSPSALRFAGSMATGALRIAGLGSALGGLSKFSVLLAVAPSSFDNYPIVFASPVDSNWQWILEFDVSGGVYCGVVSNFAPMFVPGPSLGAWTILIWTHDGDEQPTDRLWIDGDEITTIGGGTGGQPTIPYLGSDVILGGYYNDLYGLLGDLGEVLIYDHALSDRNRVMLSDYLSAKGWAGTISPSAQELPAHLQFPPPEWAA